MALPITDNELAELCTQPIRETSYSSTYRVYIKQIARTVDVSVIQMPFPKERLNSLISSGKLENTESEVRKFHQTFGDALVSAINTSLTASRDPDLSNYTLIYRDIRKVLSKENAGTGAFYLISDPCDPALIKNPFKRGKGHFSDLIMLCIRLAQMVKAFSLHGIFLGTFDLNEIFAFQDEAGKLHLKIGLPLYSSGIDERGRAVPLLVPGTLSDTVRTTADMCAESDLEAILRLLLNGLVGAPHDAKVEPGEALNALSDELKAHLTPLVQSRDSLQTGPFMKALYAISKDIKKGKIPDAEVDLNGAKAPADRSDNVQTAKEQETKPLPDPVASPKDEPAQKVLSGWVKCAGWKDDAYEYAVLRKAIHKEDN